MLASQDNVRAAGNFGKKISNESLAFYLEFTSFHLHMVVGDTTYAKAEAGTLSPEEFNTKLKYAEALLTVSFALPALAVQIAESGMLRTASVGGRGGDQELVSFTREVLALASNFAHMGNMMIPESLITDKKFKEAWFEVIQRVFPGLDEYPTVAIIASDEEALIKSARGDKLYVPEEDG